jgi:hypothetical protein
MYLNSNKNYIKLTNDKMIKLLFCNDKVWINLNDYLCCLKYDFINFKHDTEIIKNKNELLKNYTENDKEDFYTNMPGLYLILTSYENYNKELYKYNFHIMSKKIIPKIYKYEKIKKREKYNEIIHKYILLNDVASL